MQIKNVYIQGLSYAKNPSKLEVESTDIPTNFNDLHESQIDYQISNDFKKDGKAYVNIIIITKPKSPETGFVDYRATYTVCVDSLEENIDAGHIIRYAAEKSWNKIHANYVSAFSELNLPTSGFPVQPVFPNIENSESQGKDKDADENHNKKEK